MYIAFIGTKFHLRPILAPMIYEGFKVDPGDLFQRLSLKCMYVRASSLIITVALLCFRKISGVDDMITIFCDFWRFSAKKMAFFSKTNVMIKILHNVSLFWAKNANFFVETILKIITSVPGRMSSSLDSADKARRPFYQEPILRPWVTTTALQKFTAQLICRMACF
jgi:hypothetical protein